jgi:CPA1 family monovalent cation:H+ antiporter
MLLLAVAFLGICTRVLPLKLPLPLVQTALGALLGPPGRGLHVSLDPEIFMMLFIPPLLFADGWRISKRELFMARRAVLMLALGLVFMTVLAVGEVLAAAQSRIDRAGPYLMFRYLCKNLLPDARPSVPPLYSRR